MTFLAERLIDRGPGSSVTHSTSRGAVSRDGARQREPGDPAGSTTDRRRRSLAEPDRRGKRSIINNEDVTLHTKGQVFCRRTFTPSPTVTTPICAGPGSTPTRRPPSLAPCAKVSVPCPSIPGCVSQGQNREEALANSREAIAACLDVRAERGLPLTVGTQQVEVALRWLCPASGVPIRESRGQRCLWLNRRGRHSSMRILTQAVTSTNFSFAYSRNWITCSRRTDGKSSRNSSTEYPPPPDNR